MRYRIPQPHALRHPLTGEYVVPQPGVAYRDDDPLVLAFPWSFMAPDELEGADVETGTAAPGEKRSLLRPAKKAAAAKKEAAAKAAKSAKADEAPEAPAPPAEPPVEPAGDTGDQPPAPEGE